MTELYHREPDTISGYNVLALSRSFASYATVDRKANREPLNRLRTLLLKIKVSIILNQIRHIIFMLYILLFEFICI